MAVQDLRESQLDRTQETAYALRCPNGCMRVIKKRSRAFAHQGRHPCPDCGSALGCSEADERDFTLADRVSENVR